MIWLATCPLILQVSLIAVDELYYHRQRGLPLWERISHPFDTLIVLLCLACILFMHPVSAWPVYLGLAAFSCLSITKDEWIHSSTCGPAENWLHSMLYIVHPMVLGCYGWLWWLWKMEANELAANLIYLSIILVFGFFIFQIVFWNFIYKKTPTYKE